MSSCPTLTTDRLTLRPFASDDLEPLFDIMTTSQVRAALHVPADFTLAGAWGSMASYAGLWALRGVGQWALVERVSGRVIGRAGLHWRPEPDWPGVEVGWMLDPAMWGNGYATEAGARAVRYGFEVVGEDTLYSVILPENTRSASVASRLGFVEWEARVLPHVPTAAHTIWRLDREAWESSEAGASEG